MAEKTENTGKTCTVACKMPNGLILKLCAKEVRQEPVMGGGTREVDFYVPIGDGVRIYGTEVPFGATPRVYNSGGYALTPGVDAEFMREWMDQYKLSDIVKSKMIFVQSTEERARDQGREMHETRSGLERIDPDNLPREFRGRIEKATEKKAA